MLSKPQRIKLAKYALEHPELKSDIVAALKKEASQAKEAGLLSKFFSKKPSEDPQKLKKKYEVAVLHTSDPGPKKVKEQSDKYFKALDDFKKILVEHKKNAKAELKDILTLEEVWAVDPNDWENPTKYEDLRKKWADPHDRVYNSRNGYDEDQFIAAIQNLLASVVEYPA